MNINILTSEIFNRIAAGEVVNNPASVVKELVENSIDAKALSIDIEVRSGGKYIKVIDNGVGIAKEDLPTAFCAHATSKIKNLSDLDEIKTLGFRGEALPSIASVARVTISSQPASDTLGNMLVVENGIIVDSGEIGCAIGTTIIVEDLFKNVPARLKFLKSDRAEEGEIITLVSRMIFANYNVSICLTINDKIIYRSSGQGMEEAAFCVYGNDFLKETCKIESTMSDIVLKGFMCKPSYSKHNRSYQTLIINGRYVLNADISFWIYNCFSSYLMTRQYPAYILYISLPFDMIDVNIHPSKMEVKFVNFDRIRRLLSDALKAMLDTCSTNPEELELSTIEKYFEPAPGSVLPNINEGIQESTSKNVSFNLGSPLIFNDNNQIRREILVAGEQNSYSEYFEEICDSDFAARPTTSFYDTIQDFVFVGKIFNTYILLEKDNQVLFIDQHAAHERIIYDQLLEKINNGKNTVQNLLLPFVFNLSFAEAEILRSAISELEKIGFAINELSGNTFSISGVPLLIVDMKLNEFISQLVYVLSKGNISKTEFVNESIMQSSCKAAVKGNDDLSESELKYLIRLLAENKTVLKCPHGRPIVISVKKSEVEKWFKRIV